MSETPHIQTLHTSGTTKYCPHGHGPARRVRLVAEDGAGTLWVCPSLLCRWAEQINETAEAEATWGHP